MTFRDFLLLMGGATLAAWIGWGVVLFAIDPSRSGALGFLLFYLTLTSALIGTFSILGTSARVWLRKNELVSRHVARSVRQSLLFSAMIIGALLLLPHGFFRWWTIGLLILGISLIETAVLLSRSSRRA